METETLASPIEEYFDSYPADFLEELGFGQNEFDDCYLEEQSLASF